MKPPPSDIDFNVMQSHRHALVGDRTVLPLDAEELPPAPYPEDLSVMVSEPTFTVEDFPALRAKYGKHIVLLLRGAEGIGACLAVTAVVKVGIMGRHTKAVPVAAVTGYLAAEDLRAFEGRAAVLVCAPPLDAGLATALASLALSEDSYFQSKLRTVASLDAVLGVTEARAGALVDEMIRYLSAGTTAHRSRAHQVLPPTGEWNIYTSGGPTPPQDVLARAIKAFANASTGVYPPLPIVDDDEVGALLGIHDHLCSNQMRCEANRLIRAALGSPMFARLCHHPEIFAADRDPPICVPWAGFGPDMLRYLRSEGLTAAARSVPRPEPLTLAAPYVLTLREVLALGVPNAPRDEAHAFQRLDAYVGGYLASLDLRKTLVTGSAIAAALIITKVEECYFTRNEHAAKVKNSELMTESELAEFEEWLRIRAQAGYEAYLAAHYPTTKTTPRNRDEYLELVAMIMAHPDNTIAEYETTFGGDGSALLELTARRMTHDQMTMVETRCALLDVHGGADVDMSVDVETNEEFDAVVASHYAAIRARYPAAALHKVPRGDEADPRYNWAITCEGCTDFRPVELYRGSFKHVVTHHVGMVSGAFTSLFSTQPQFVMSARLPLAMASLATPDYYYFASRKASNTPQLIVMKYFMRGFGLETFPAGIRAAIGAVFNDDPLWACASRDKIELRYPALHAKGNFSAYAIAAELAAFQNLQAP
jgi:hypothetical protein